MDDCKVPWSYRSKAQIITVLYSWYELLICYLVFTKSDSFSWLNISTFVSSVQKNIIPEVLCFLPMQLVPLAHFHFLNLIQSLISWSLIQDSVSQQSLLLELLPEGTLVATDTCWVCHNSMILCTLSLWRSHTVWLELPNRFIINRKGRRGIFHSFPLIFLITECEIFEYPHSFSYFN